MIGQLFAGAGLGLLVGLLVGLSSSPVVSVVVGALSAGLVALLGFARPGKEGDGLHAEGSVLRLGSFGAACAVALLLGLLIRAHGWASPTIKDQVDEVQKAGYSPEEARKWVAFRNVGTALDANREPARPGSGSAFTAGSVLFSSTSSGECQNFDTSRYKNPEEHLNALRQMGGKYAEYAERISLLDANQQKMVLDSLKLLFCPQ